VVDPNVESDLFRRAVKICGLREPAHARAAAAAGADLLGFVFAPSRRRVDTATARACISRAREGARGRTFLAVGVFTAAVAEEMNETAAAAELDLLQLHGNDDATIGERLRCPFVVALHPSPDMTVADIEATISAYMGSGRPPVAFLIDGYRAGQFGGQGIRADWGLARELARRWPVILAGGLNADNVSEAILTVAPTGVDVSSGVETDGIKDIEKIRAFVHAAREGFARLGRE
jgi:phosphoribosylanthranilate isomerase